MVTSRGAVQINQVFSIAAARDIPGDVPNLQRSRWATGIALQGVAAAQVATA